MGLPAEVATDGVLQKKVFLKPQACNFIKKRLWNSCFLVNFAKFSRTLFLQNTSRQLLPFLEALKMLKADSAVLENILTTENDEKCFLFHRKSSFRSQDF